MLYTQHHLLQCSPSIHECPITTELFQKNGYDVNACNKVRDILHNIDVMTSVVKLIVRSPADKLIQLTNNYTDLKMLVGG